MRVTVGLLQEGLEPEKAKLLESGASSSQTPRARTAWLGSENSRKGALAWLGSDFIGAAWFYLLIEAGKY